MQADVTACITQHIVNT